MVKRWSRRAGFGLMGMTALLFAFGCASGSGSSGGTDTTRITAEEMASVNVSTLYEVVDRLRPRWLEARATRSAFGGSQDAAVVVFMGRSYLGGVDELRRIGIDAASWLEYLSGAEAQGRLPGIGSRHVEGAIIIHTVDPRE